MLIWLYIRTFIRPSLILFFLISIGTLGFVFIDNFQWINALFMTVITISTVGFEEVEPLSHYGKIFTIFLIFGGVGFYGYLINVIVKSFVEIRFKELMKTIKMKNTIENLKDHYIICGGGRMAYTIGVELEKAGKSFLFIENNPDSPVMENYGKWLVINKNALLEETLIEARIEKAKGLASVLPTDADNLFVVLSARSLKKDIYIVTRIGFESTNAKMIQAGADKVVSPYTMGGTQIARSFISPEINDFLDIVMDKASYEFEFQIYKIKENDPLVDKYLKETQFREKGYIVISIKDHKGKLTFAPEADFQLKLGHEILLIGGAKKLA
jgi:voltage-gated potassium channel